MKSELWKYFRSYEIDELYISYFEIRSYIMLLLLIVVKVLSHKRF